MCTEKPVLNASFQDFWCTNIHCTPEIFNNLNLKLKYQLCDLNSYCELRVNSKSTIVNHSGIKIKISVGGNENSLALLYQVCISEI